MAADQSRTSPPRMRRSPVRLSISSTNPAVARIEPSGLNAIALTRPPQSRSRSRARPDETSHSLRTAVKISSRQGLAVRTEGQREDRIRALERVASWLSRSGIPEPSRSIRSTGGDQASVRD